jgi:hypothetical protein
VANVPIWRNEVSAQTSDEHPNEAAHTLVNIYTEPGDEVMGTPVDYVQPHQGTHLFDANIGVGKEDLGVAEGRGCWRRSPGGTWHCREAPEGPLRIDVDYHRESNDRVP